MFRFLNISKIAITIIITTAATAPTTTSIGRPSGSGVGVGVTAGVGVGSGVGVGEGVHTTSRGVAVNITFSSVLLSYNDKIAKVCVPEVDSWWVKLPVTFWVSNSPPLVMLTK